MPNDLAINPKTTAVLAMDYQVGVITDEPRKAALAKAVPVVRAARAAGITMSYGVIRFDERDPAVPASNWSFTSFKAAGRMRKGTPDAAVHPDVAPAPGDIVIERRRAGVFPGTDLDTILRSKNIDTIALFGISTGGQVLSAVRAGVDLDYSLFVLSDCCTDRDEELHRFLMTKVLTVHSKVITSEDFITAIKKGA